MNKSIIILLIIVVIFFLAYVARNSFNNNPSKESNITMTPSMSKTGLERAIFLVNQSSPANTLIKTPVFYEIPKEYVVQSQGYKTSSSVLFALYELTTSSNPIPLSELCEQFKKDSAVGNEYTVCTTNGNVLMLGFATQQDKNILDNIVQSFAGEE